MFKNYATCQFNSTHLGRLLLSTSNSIIILQVFISLQAFSQYEKWDWLKVISGAGMDEVCSSTTDITGNVYIVGHFQKDLQFEDIQLISIGDNDIFIAKYNRFGSLLWAKQAGGHFSENLIVTEYPKIVKTDDDGNLIVSGCFTWQSEFGGISISGPGKINIFIAKYSPDGDLIWVKSFGSKSTVFLYDMDVSGNDIFISGFAPGPLYSGDPTEFNELCPYLCISGNSPFLINFDPNGSIIWVHTDTCSVEKSCVKVIKNEVLWLTYHNKTLYKLPDSDNAMGFNVELKCYSKFGDLKWKRCRNFADLNLFDTISKNNMQFLVSPLKGFIRQVDREENSQLKTKTLNNPDYEIATIHNSNQDRRIHMSNERTCYFPEQRFYIESISFTNPVLINDSLIVPDGIWFNSLLLLWDFENRHRYLLDAIPGAIVSILPVYDNSTYYVAGTHYSGQQLFSEYISGWGTDVFIGKRILHNDEESLFQMDFDVSSENRVWLRPNPANNYCEMISNIETIVRNVSISDNMGRVFQRYGSATLPVTFDLSKLESGFYIVSFIDNDIEKSIKLCVIK